MRLIGFLSTLAIAVSSANGFVIRPGIGVTVGTTRATCLPTGKARIQNKHQRISSTLLQDTLTSEPAVPKTVMDWSALGKYIVAIGIQMGLISVVLGGLDCMVKRFSLNPPFAVNFVLFYLFALKSRVFNPLSNKRPQSKTLETDQVTTERKMPSWTPPGVVFPIMWLLIIAPIRSVSSCMVYRSVGNYLSLPILSLMLHLAIGDVWNTINNVERRYGTSVLGVLDVWLSKAHAAYRYSVVNATAGKLLALPLIWLTIASTLITTTWRINPDPVTGKPDSLLPTKMEGQPSRTKFAWFSGKS